MASQDSLKDAEAEAYVAAMVPEAAKPRVGIDEFLADNEMTNLFLLALSENRRRISRREADPPRTLKIGGNSTPCPVLVPLYDEVLTR